MNSKKYDGKYHEFRKISDIREMLLTSTDLFAEKTAYLEKDKKLKKYMPIIFLNFFVKRISYKSLKVN